MMALLAGFLVLHGALHLLGAAKAFGWAQLPQLTHAISPAAGAGWLASALLFAVAGIAVLIAPRWWWLITAVAVAVSLPVIALSWTDAKAGAAVDLVVVVAVGFGFATFGPYSLRAAYDADVAGIARDTADELRLTERDLAHPRCQCSVMFESPGPWDSRGFATTP